MATFPFALLRRRSGDLKDIARAFLVPEDGD